MKHNSYKDLYFAGMSWSYETLTWMRLRYLVGHQTKWYQQREELIMSWHMIVFIFIVIDLEACEHPVPITGS